MQPETPCSVRYHRPAARLPRVVHPAKPGEEPITDRYGQPVTETRRRLRGCRCAVPCLGFTCESSHHKGSRQTPWCRGGDDPADAKALGGVENERAYSAKSGNPIERCDDCWAANGELQQAIALRDRLEVHRAA